MLRSLTVLFLLAAMGATPLVAAQCPMGAGDPAAEHEGGHDGSTEHHAAPSAHAERAAGDGPHRDHGPTDPGCGTMVVCGSPASVPARADLAERDPANASPEPSTAVAPSAGVRLTQDPPPPRLPV